MPLCSYALFCMYTTFGLNFFKHSHRGRLHEHLKNHVIVSMIAMLLTSVDKCDMSTLNIVFSVTYHLLVLNAIAIHCISHFLPIINVALVVWILWNINIFTWYKITSTLYTYIEREHYVTPNSKRQ
jgi:hypothetical protein